MRYPYFQKIKLAQTLNIVSNSSHLGIGHFGRNCHHHRRIGTFTGTESPKLCQRIVCMLTTYARELFWKTSTSRAMNNKTQTPIC